MHYIKHFHIVWCSNKYKNSSQFSSSGHVCFNSLYFPNNAIHCYSSEPRVIVWVDTKVKIVVPKYLTSSYFQHLHLQSVIENEEVPVNKKKKEKKKACISAEWMTISWLVLYTLVSWRNHGPPIASLWCFLCLVEWNILWYLGFSW